MSEIETLSLLFDSAWYLATYQDVAAANCDPLEHYLNFGYQEGRNPNRFFNTNFYLNTYPDIGACHLNPFIHYILYGASEGRLPRSPNEGPLPPITFDIFLQEDETIPTVETSTKVVEETVEAQEEPVQKENKPTATKSKKIIRKPAPKVKADNPAPKRRKTTKN